MAAELDATDPATAHLTLTGEEWTAFTAEATSISIAATSQLRGSAWGDQPFVAAPEWARASMPIHASAELPLEVRESLTSIASFLDSISASGVQTTTYWEADTLALLGAETGGAGDKVMAARFHAYPFADPATGLVYARARWFDPATGSFFSPDPMGYQDSTNLYAFGGGDPVKGRDPSGRAVVEATVAAASAAAGSAAVAAGGAAVVVAASAVTTGIAIRLTWDLLDDWAATKEAESRLRETQDLSRNRRGPIPRPLAPSVPELQASSAQKKSGDPNPESNPEPKPLPVTGSLRSSGREANDGEEQWVVRGGMATPRNLQNSVGEHTGTRGVIGFSVQSEPGMSVEALAKAGQFRHATIGVTTVAKLRAVGVRVVKTPGKGFHCTAVTPMPLSDALAATISAVFEPLPNPHQVK